MKFKGTLGLVAVFAALALYTYFVDSPREQAKLEQEARERQLLSFNHDDVQGLTLVQADQTLRLERTEQNLWLLTEPLPALADLMAVDDVIVHLREARRTRVLEENTGDLKPFGLDPPFLKISIQLAGGATEEVHIGAPAPVGHSFYARFAGGKEVVLATLDRDALNKSLHDLRDKTILTFNTSDLTGFEITYQGETQVFEKSDGAWHLTRGLTADGDREAIENLLNQLQMGRVQRFVEEKPMDLTAYGLVEPRIVFNARSEKETWSLRIGGAAKEDRYFAQNEPSGKVFTVNRALVLALSQPPVTYMDKALVRLKEDQVAELRIRQGTETIQIRRDADDSPAWSIESPLQARASAATVNSLLFDLRDARVGEFFKQTDRSLFGLEVPQRELSIHLKDGGVHTLLVGNPNADRSLFFASRSSDGNVFTLKSETVGKLFRSLDDLQFKTLLTFDSEKAARIELRYPGQTFQLKRTGQSWRLEEPEIVDPVAPFVARDILWTLGHLEFVTRSAPTPETEQSLIKPELAIIIATDSGGELARLDVGAKAPGQPQRYARIPGRAEIYTIGDRFLDEIPDRVERFKKSES